MSEKKNTCLKTQEVNFRYLCMDVCMYALIFENKVQTCGNNNDLY